MGWLDLLILFFCCVIEVFLLYDYFNNFFESKLKRKYIKILCAGTIGAIFLVNMLQSSILNHIPDVDLITMLGNLLDNAILAASKKEKDTSVIVRIFMQKEGKLCVIKVVNDFVEKIQEDRGRLISTKKEAGIHGIGLASVSKIAEQNNGYLEHYISDGKFNAVVVLAV